MLRATAGLAPESIEVVLYGDLGSLPFPDPDLDGASMPASVLEVRREIAVLLGRGERMRR